MAMSESRPPRVTSSNEESGDSYCDIKSELEQSLGSQFSLAEFFFINLKLYYKLI